MTEVAYFGAGCFWCSEAAFQQVKGVTRVTPGYAGGSSPNPSYNEVSTGITGHAEVAAVEFDASIISYFDLLAIFFLIHNPTTPNRQGADVGSQYRSTILTTTPSQEAAAKKFIQQLQVEQVYSKPIVTEVKPLDTFYPAENYHVDYYKKNATAPYCELVISPKLHKLREHYQKFLK